MDKVFADTLYRVALVHSADAWHEPARRARDALGSCVLVTTDEVLDGVVTTFARGGPKLREKAVATVRTILANPDVKVVAQSRDTFLRALDRYANRADKSYSLTDCASMNAMDAEGIRDVLTNDHHFEQEGYNVLVHK